MTLGTGLREWRTRLRKFYRQKINVIGIEVEMSAYSARELALVVKGIADRLNDEDTLYLSISPVLSFRIFSVDQDIKTMEK